MRKTWWLAGAMLVAGLGCKPSEGASTGGGGPPGARGGGAPDKSKMQFPVEVTPVAVRRVDYSVFAVGSVEALESMQITARVAGAVDKVAFNEGDVVKEGRTLVEIEPDRYRLAVETAKANLQRVEAVKADAEALLARRESALEKVPGAYPQEELDVLRTRVRTASADLAAAETALKLAELNLRDALVRAPATGTIQTRTVQPGQYVQPGTVMATMLRKDVLVVRFHVPEQDAARLQPGMKAEFVVAGTDRTFTLTLTHVSDLTNPNSRLVPVLARIEDGDRNVLRPGAFAQVTIPVGGADDAPVIPQIAVRPSERGFLAFVVEDGLARERTLTLGMRTQDGLVEVRSGVRSGESLVIRGAEALRDGAPVRVVPPQPTAPREGVPSAQPAPPTSALPDGGGARDGATATGQPSRL
ncbi:MAG: efflux RND transporter periplasmic adaptor subunit [Myxococcota bacterium]